MDPQEIKELLKEFNNTEGNHDKLYYDDYMIKFAKYVTKIHVQAALQKASIEVTCSEETQYDQFDNTILIAKINKESILNAYPLENIK